VLEPGPKPNTVIVPVPDCVLQYLGWKEGDYVETTIRWMGGDECLVVTRARPPAREGY
jgi:hypothetical protein